MNNSKSPRGTRISLITAVPALLLLVAGQATAQSFHEFPANGDQVSGVGLMRGWSCDAETVTFSIDGAAFVDAVYGLGRDDTEAQCGDSNNGYAALISWSQIGQGVHNLIVRTDQRQIARLKFSVGGAGDSFIFGLEHRGVTYGVPDPQSLCTFQWQRAAQNLELAQCTQSRPSGPGTDAKLGMRTITVESDAHGSQIYDAFIPDGYTPSKPIALVVGLHGAGGGAPGVRNGWATHAQDDEFIVVAPRAAGEQDVWEPGVDESWVVEVIDDISARYNIERSRVYLWGFSAGGHFAHALGLDGTATYAAYSVSAGTLGFAGPDAPQRAMRTIPVLLQVGTGDTVQIPFVRDDLVRFTAADWVEDLNVALETFPGGHTYTSETLASAWRFMSLFTLPGEP